jgi:isoamylase
VSRVRLRVSAGSPYTLGAVPDGRGVNFAVFSANATRIEVCLFDQDGKTETARVALPENTNEVWHGYIPGLKAGQLYGLRAYGPYSPREGHRFNPNRLLIDPYARLLAGKLTWNDAHFGYVFGGEAADLGYDERDSAPFMPKCVVVAPRPPSRTLFAGSRKKVRRTPWTDTIIYEAHVKGLTMLNPDVPEAIRGTFAGLGHHKTIEHLVRLGVTTLELMPVHAFYDDRHLVEKGLHNYWGYSTLCFFAPASHYLKPRSDLAEIRTAIERLHEAGLEVLLDVVYNHTAEGNHLGPTLSFRGLDNAAYYKLADDPRYYQDTTGCGNTLNVGHPRVLQLVMDSLRYWAEEFHIDGFRFDLATSLGRDQRAFNNQAALFTAIGQDPVLSRTKLIAEPWDLGEDGYQVGNFPPGWAEWNGRYRDDTRSYWRGDEGFLPALTSRLLGSADLFDKRGRRPWTSINFVTAHDGFTLADLFSYSGKHNEANQENNGDGHGDNRSWNCGVEGPSDDYEVALTRHRMRRNLIAGLLFSQGTPMILMGDEVGRSQAGNNNAYCQDNETSWLKWSDLDALDESFFTFVRGLVDLRRRLPLLRQGKFLHGDTVRKGLKDATWLRADGKEMTPADWSNSHCRSVGLMLGDNSPQPHALLLFTNAYHEKVSFRVPAPADMTSWRLLVDTARGLLEPPEPLIEGGTSLAVPGRSQLLFEARRR